jgi:hypothetical protein
VLTKSIRLTEEEATQLREYLETTGQVEATVLKQAAMRGLRDMRLDQGILAYLNGRSSTEAAEIAGLSRGDFLQALIDKGIAILDGLSTLAGELAELAKRLGDETLHEVAAKLDESST